MNQPTHTTVARNSNIEFLRILCMLMVVILHFNNHGANTGIVNMPSQLTPTLTWGFLVESFCIIAVNCFLLFSGFFSISLKWRSVLKFYLQCFFIGMFAYLLYVWLSPATISCAAIFERLLAFTHNGWWFVVSYVGLMLVSPIINRAVDGLSKRQMLSALGLYAIVIIYLGWYQQVEPTHNGCSLINFIFIYLVGRYIGKYVERGNIQRYRWLWLLGYVLTALIIFALVMLRYHCGWEIRYVFDYNHPLVIIAAVMLFLFALSFSFKSRAINWIASSVFSTYLLQESILFGHEYLYPKMEVFFTHVPSGWNIGVLFLVSIIFLLVSVLIDKVFSCISKNLLALIKTTNN